MDVSDGKRMFDELQRELLSLEPQWDSTECQAWKLRAERTLIRLFGDEHPLTVEMHGVVFFPADLSTRRWTVGVVQEAFKDGRNRALAILRTALFEVEKLGPKTSFVGDTTSESETRRKRVWNWTKIGAVATVVAALAALVSLTVVFWPPSPGDSS